VTQRARDVSAAEGVWARAAAAFAASEAAATLRQLLPPLVCAEVASTQDELRSLARDGAPSGTVVIAERQSQGRGRIGRSWQDSERPGASLALSFLLDLPMQSAHLVPHAVGLGVLEAVDPLREPGRPEQLGLKWPNDVVAVEGSSSTPRKLAGTLVEREQVDGRDVLLIGLGLNVDRRDEEQPDDRTCLARAVGSDVDLTQLLARLLPALDTALERLSTPVTLLDAYRERCVTIGRSIIVERPGATTLVGVATGIDANGRLEIATKDGAVPVLAGTVRDAGPERDVEEARP
jgi:BirA family transcriptional regulator, biotin operon repressor / biotin---[acetyl-CoA-carboxylase] ligase